jgi:putative transposase
MIWLSLSHAAALLEISERRLRDRIGEFTTRENGKAANGKPIKEILLESLPIDAQQKYFDDLTSPAPTPAGDAEGGSEDASSSPGAPAPTPSAPNQGRDEGRGSSGGSSEHSTLAGLSEQHLAELNDLADALRAFGHSTPDPRPLPLLGMSPSTIRRKLRALQKHGLAGLARKVRADRGRARVADEKVVARIKAEYLKPYRPFATNIYKEIAKDYEMSNAPAPSYSFVLRKTKEIDPDLVARFRHGEREFDDQFAYVTLRQKPALPRQWCDADHHIMDHLVIFDDGSIGRPWLTAIQDICTDEITGYVLSREKRTTYPGARAIGLTLRKAVLKKADPAWPSFGLFENFYADLGKDFRGQYIRAVCHDLGTTIRHTRGYHGKSKPIERFFGVLEAGLKRLPGYVGRSPETNPLKQDIGAGRDWESMRGEILTIDQFEAALYRWITAEFHHAESRALRGLSPLGALETHVKNGWQPREVASERALDLLLMNRSAKKVQRFGIQLFSSLHTQRYFMAP